MTTFDGVGVRTGPPSPPGPGGPPGTVGSEPPRSSQLTDATTTRPIADSVGAVANGRRRPADAGGCSVPPRTCWSAPAIRVSSPAPARLPGPDRPARDRRRGWPEL